MVPQSKAKIFPAAERGLNESSCFRSYNSFNHKTPFGTLYVLNEDTLAGKHSVTMQVEHDSDIILIPVVGAIACEEILVQAGQTQLLSLSGNTSFTITNPYETELVKFLQLWIKVDNRTTARLTDFDLEAGRNTLVKTGNGLLMGIFDGRTEVTYNVQQPGNALFAFVIEGAFEIQYRLLETGDSLGLWETEEIELEALSENAIILIVEMPV